MDKKIELQVCSGTACFIMGGSDLLTVFEYLTQEERDAVLLRAIPCLDSCKNQEELRPPFIKIDGQLYGRMNMDKLLFLLREKINS